MPEVCAYLQGNHLDHSNGNREEYNLLYSMFGLFTKCTRINTILTIPISLSLF